MKLSEPRVEVKARAEDLDLVRSVLDEAAAAYEKLSGKKVALTLAKDTLPPSPKNAGPKALATWSDIPLFPLDRRVYF